MENCTPRRFGWAIIPVILGGIKPRMTLEGNWSNLEYPKFLIRIILFCVCYSTVLHPPTSNRMLTKCVDYSVPACYNTSRKKGKNIMEIEINRGSILTLIRVGAAVKILAETVRSRLFSMAPSEWHSYFTLLIGTRESAALYWSYPNVFTVLYPQEKLPKPIVSTFYLRDCFIRFQCDSSPWDSHFDAQWSKCLTLLRLEWVKQVDHRIFSAGCSTIDSQGGDAVGVAAADELPMKASSRSTWLGGNGCSRRALGFVPSAGWIQACLKGSGDQSGFPSHVRSCRALDHWTLE
jgi:hypothetical protein